MVIMNIRANKQSYQLEMLMDLPAQLLGDLSPAAILSAVNDMVKKLDDRGKRVISARFGLTGKNSKTLQAIGDDENVTRERVRQIEVVNMSAMRSLDKAKEISESTKKTKEALQRLLQFLGGVVRLEILSRLLNLKTDAERAALRLLLCLSPRVSEKKESTFYVSYFSSEGSLDTDRICTDAKKILTENRKLLKDEEFLEKISEKSNGIRSKAALVSALSVSKDIVRTSFGEWGLRNWVEACPRGVGDKAYAVLKRTNEPRHFTQITEMINDAKFDHRKAHPQTVHNELIRDERFVLVGRGIYGLREWGFLPGTVGDVLMRIMKKAPKPLMREDIIEMVLKERFVKRNTILLALQNAEHFTVDREGRYFLKEANKKQTLTEAAETPEEGSGVA